jgi:hypothetical protein
MKNPLCIASQGLRKVMMAFCLLIYTCLQICALLGWFGAGAGRECADFGKISGFFFLSPLQGM